MIGSLPSKRLAMCAAFSKALRQGMNDSYSFWSVGYERNIGWQGVEENRIIPIPYVVKLPLNKDNDNDLINLKKKRTKDFVFYAGD